MVTGLTEDALLPDVVVLPELEELLLATAFVLPALFALDVLLPARRTMACGIMALPYGWAVTQIVIIKRKTAINLVNHIRIVQISQADKEQKNPLEIFVIAVPFALMIKSAWKKHRKNIFPN